MDALHKRLEMELGMKDQAFEVKDCEGNTLATDADLHGAIASGRAPLAASLSDSSIHFIENRREELSQIQWKIVRDQQHAVSEKFRMLTLKHSELEAAFEAERHNRVVDFEGLKQDIAVALDQIRTEASHDIRQMGEQMAGMSNMMAAERNMREVTKQRISTEIQTVRDLIESRCETVQESMNNMLQQSEALRRAVDCDRSVREASETKQMEVQDKTSRRIDEMQAHFDTVLQEYQNNFQKACSEMNASVDTHSRNIGSFKHDLDAQHSAGEARVAMVEERCHSIESRLADLSGRHADTVERFGQRSEKVTQELEFLKLGANRHQTSIEEVVQKIDDLHVASATTKGELIDQLQADRKRREREFNMLKDTVSTETVKNKHDLETRLATRLERESVARENIMAEVVASLQKHDFKYPRCQPADSDASTDAASTSCTTNKHMAGGASSNESVATYSPSANSVGQQIRSHVQPELRQMSPQGALTRSASARGQSLELHPMSSSLPGPGTSVILPSGGAQRCNNPLVLVPGSSPQRKKMVATAQQQQASPRNAAYAAGGGAGMDATGAFGQVVVSIYWPSVLKDAARTGSGHARG
eukprot:CAMPEP_0117474592 /NCGR_PEP_ID=MMETSP0784-20121206/9363_1 /TAXON_ID=39447 /ORGANISM="" /LENGTH=590 /DNA_ID=CAMNT_0005268821 /DNA_START=257 /DNA_END=2025 /DNA_ORIENTATION=-